MTNTEAIRKLKDILEEAIDTEDAVCYVTSVDEEPLRMAIEALEKQLPKKPVLEKTKGVVGIDMWHCPVCDGEIISDWNRDIANSYCHHCGQALDWSDEEWKESRNETNR